MASIDLPGSLLGIIVFNWMLHDLKLVVKLEGQRLYIYSLVAVDMRQIDLVKLVIIQFEPFIICGPDSSELFGFFVSHVSIEAAPSYLVGQL